jgi:alanine racemase
VDSLRAWTEIDLDALALNLRSVCQRAGPGVRIMLVVKQDAYGHGAVAISHHALRCGIGALGVGTSQEALDLRQAGLRGPILILGTVVEGELPACLRHEIQVGLHAVDRCRSLQKLAQSMGLQARVHLNVDTGMGRLGVSPSLALDLLREVHAASHLQLAGLMTHLSAPEGGHCPSSHEQLALFQGLIAAARAEGLPCGWIHALNSAGLFTDLRAAQGSEAGAEMVRVGIAAYGALPRHLAPPEGLQQVMSLRSRVVFLKDVPVDAPVGYGSLWRAPRPTRIATLPIGYGHGLPRNLQSWDVLIGGRRAPLVGQLSMDYTTVDVGHLEGVHVGQEVTLLGKDGEEELRLEDLAHNLGTIPHELTCSLGRLPRVFVGGAEPFLPAQSPSHEHARMPVTPPPLAPAPEIQGPSRS